MKKPNLNLSYHEQDGMLLPNIQISNRAEDDCPLGDMEGWRSPICARITRIAIRH